MVSATGEGDPLALARVTVLGSVVELRDDERIAALDAYRERHPDAFYAAFDDFRLYRLDVASVRYVGGFGRMSWVSADDHAAAEPDPLHPHAAGIVEHMNDDHADALVAYCRVFGGRPTTASRGDGRGGPVRVHDAGRRRGRRRTASRCASRSAGRSTRSARSARR